jgi:aryl-alcohol dehydrogenase-like predicted oxidoreductase
MKLGTTDLEVSPLTLGTWAFAGGALWGEQALEQSIAAVHAALDNGITVFDTAPGYGDGESERVLGRALDQRRGEAIIATKVSPTKLAYADTLASVEASLKRLRTDHVDLLQVHWANHEVPFAETISAFNKLKEQGKVRHVGVCNFGPRDMVEWIAAGGELVSNQLPYSLLTRSIEFEIVPECERAVVSILPYSPLMQGMLTGKYRTADEVPEGRARSRHFSKNRPGVRHGESGCEAATFEVLERIRVVSDDLGVPMEQVALAWLLSKRPVASVIVGARDAQQVEKNIRSTRLVLPPEVLLELDEATVEVKQHLGANPDLWEGNGRYR